MTLEGTNTYVLDGLDGSAIVIDPGPSDEGHIAAVRAAAESRGGIGTVLLTHSHGDHSDGVPLLGIEPLRPADGDVVGPLTALATPGHAADHLCFIARAAPGREAEEAAINEAFVGDLIAGWGSSIVPPRQGGGSLREYMESLRKLQTLGLEVMHPGHGPDISDPEAKIAEYLAHRQEREDKLVAAISSGERDPERLLDAGWGEIGPEMRPMAAVAMQAHLEKLQDEGSLPADMSV